MFLKMILSLVYFISVLVNTSGLSSCDGIQTKIRKELRFRQDEKRDFFADVLPLIMGTISNVSRHTAPELSNKVGTNYMEVVVWKKIEDVEIREELHCVHVKYVVEDVDECRLPVGHPWRHKCHSSAVCKNTEGSYECACDAGKWGVNLSGSMGIYSATGSIAGLCGGENSTADCCLEKNCQSDMEDKCLNNCRSDFRCTSDPCEGVDCGMNAVCKSGYGFGEYVCECNEGYEMKDGYCQKYIKPVNNACLQENACPLSCQCTPIGVDEYECSAPEGYEAHFFAYDDPKLYHLRLKANMNGYTRRDTLKFCKSIIPPKVVLNGPAIAYYSQGDEYHEYKFQLLMPDGRIIDHIDNDAYLVTVAYSDNFFPHFRNIGEYSVTYSLGDSSVTRKMIVQDVDECRYKGNVDFLIPRCSNEAKCSNTIGSYTCRCSAGYEGDGRKDGTGCMDSQPPSLQCVGEGCRKQFFKAAIFKGVSSVNGQASYEEEEITEEYVEGKLEKLLSEICGEEDMSQCFKAVDKTYYGVENLTHNIVRGSLERVKHAPLLWRVAFNVRDKAGNVAETQYIYLEVEQADILYALQNVTVSAAVYNFFITVVKGVISIFTLILSFGVLCILIVVVQAISGFFKPIVSNNYEEYHKGYDKYLKGRSLGRSTPLQRRRKSSLKWLELMNNFIEIGNTGNRGGRPSGVRQRNNQPLDQVNRNPRIYAR